MEAPLRGLRVLELAAGIAGPYAGRLLAMCGATVAKVEPPGGDPTRRKPVDDEPLERTSPLYEHLNAGKRNLSRADLLPATWPDVVLDGRVRSQVTGDRWDPAAQPEDGTGPLIVSVTAWGFEAPEPGGVDDELVIQAASGIIGETGDAGDAPLRLPGWQAQYFAGACAAVGALVALRVAGTRHVDVAIRDTLLTGIELHYADGLMTGRRRSPSGPYAPTAFPGGAIPCRDGHVCPGSFREIDWELQCLFYGLPELVDDERFSTRAARAEHVDELWDLIRGWYERHTKQEIFQHALDSPWAVGMVMTGLDALSDPHIAARGLLGPIATPDGAVTAPVQPFRTSGLPIAGQSVHRAGEDDDWAATQATDPVPDPSDGEQRPAGAADAPGERRVVRRSGSRLARRPFGQLRLLELTVAWAGPFAGNLLGQLGLDIVKVEALSPFDGYRVLRIHADGDRDDLAHLAADNRWYEISSIHNALNRNKRGLVCDLSHPEGRQVFLDLARDADAVLCNFTAKVMPQLGLDYADLAAVNPAITVVRMPAFGTTGPYSHAAGYGSIVEAMGGLGARFGYEREDARISATYWPDPVAGIHAALALAAGLEHRDRTGVGLDIDLAHTDAMWCQLGEAVVTASRQARNVGRLGNREPGVACSEVVAAADGRWVAVVGPAAAADAVANAHASPSADVVAAVRHAGGSAAVVNDILDGTRDPALAERFEVVEHPITGPVRQVRAPYRLDGEPTRTRFPAPLFDQHTDEILAEAGYAPDRIAQLRAAGVVGGVLPNPREMGHVR